MTEAETAERAKRAAAERAVELIEPGMRLGLGTGSTAAHFVRALGERAARERLDLACAATSEATAALAAECGLAVRDLDALGRLDLTVDGADELDGRLRLIKGGGGALLREKIVAAASERLVVIADEGKRVETLGAFPLPVEVVRFGWKTTRAAILDMLEKADVETRGAELRVAGEAPRVTDEGHLILDLALRRIGAPEALASALVAVPGVVEHGLFLGLAAQAILGRADGSCAVIAPTGADGLTPDEARVWADELTRSIEQ